MYRNEFEIVAISLHIWSAALAKFPEITMVVCASTFTLTTVGKGFVPLSQPFLAKDSIFARDKVLTSLMIVGPEIV